ncbi:hypothetical protein DKX38_001725 [Salix brachista]|uniref:Uncharacterized protein n=1 Tax=Salix brachista TaxID=2182728 RepID=A0A5N5P6Y0_9ROSI|nr:hypothetical protein DKX38_001725 [Salix brachista]
MSSDFLSILIVLLITLLVLLVLIGPLPWSSVPQPTGRSATSALALPAPDGTTQRVQNQDPFAASLTVPPPSYVQVAEMERKQRLLVNEQQLWEHYGRDGMHGQVDLTKINDPSGYYGPSPHPVAMPQVSGMRQQGGHSYPSY